MRCRTVIETCPPDQRQAVLHEIDARFYAINTGVWWTRLDDGGLHQTWLDEANGAQRGFEGWRQVVELIAEILVCLSAYRQTYPARPDAGFLDADAETGTRCTCPTLPAIPRSQSMT